MSKNKQSKKTEKRAATGLGGLANALIQAGHLSENRAKALARDKRKKEKSLGRKEVHERTVAERSAEQVARDAKAQADRTQAVEQGAETVESQAKQAIRKHRINDGGNRRWFFVARDRKVPFILVSDTTMKRLESGDAGIVETLGAVKGRHVVVGGRGALQTLWGFDREAVRFWNRRSDS